MSALLLPLRGIIPPMIAPLSSPETLDVEGAERLTEHLIAGGVHGIFILGSTGEGPSLSPEIQRQLIETTVRQTNGRVPVLVGITDTCLANSLSLAEISADLGVSAVVASSPCYFQIGQPELLDYCHKLVAEVPLPLVLYNMPGLTKVSFEPDTVRQMLQYEKVIGIKDSSGDLDVAASYVKVIAERPDWTLMTGPEELLADAIKIGVMGGVCGGGNLFPRLFVDLYEAAIAKDTAKIELLHNAVLQLGKTLYGVGQYSTSYMKGIKCALSCLGICDDHMALPLKRFAEKERSVIKQRIEKLSELEAVGVQSVLASHTT